jgi:monoamine oxidase
LFFRLRKPWKKIFIVSFPRFLAMAPHRRSPVFSLRTGFQLLIGSSLTLFSIPVHSAAIPESVDVAIVGAGLSGLSAAKNLIAGGKSVVVLEARDRVGGKVLNKPLKNGGVTEVGAEFVGPTQDRVLATIAELGLETFHVYNTGSSVWYRDGVRTTYVPDPATGGLPPIDDVQLLQVATLIGEIDQYASEINVSAPWSHPQAAYWDSITLAQWVDLHVPLPDAKLLLETFSRAVFAAETREISFLYVVAYVASAGDESNPGNLSRLISVDNAAQEQRVVGGTGLIPQGLARVVGSNKIIFNAAVSAVTKQRDGSYKVVSKAGTVKAKKVVIALGPVLMRRITFTPALPNARQQLNKKMFMPAIGKGIAVYDSPFWRTDEDLNAQVISDKGATKVTFDNTPEGDTPAFGAIMGFILGDDMRALDSKTPAQVQEAVVSAYVNCFGQKAKNVTDFVLQRWDLEEWSKGGPVAVAGPGVIQQYGPALRAVVDGIHFAGTETAEYWTGYMDGAIRSGERVAKEILGS